MKLRRITAIAAAVMMSSCAGPALREQADTISTLVKTAREHGAMRCAPVALAMAEAHREFGLTALGLGDSSEARRELELSIKNAHTAVDDSPVEQCGDKPPDRDGDGIIDSLDQCPDQPEDKDGFKDDDGCPDPDNDGDGIPDAVDKCPDVAEDRDGFEDADGCPDLDNDHDGIADKIDQCPDQAEDKDGFEDADGCPDCDDDKDGVPECILPGAPTVPLDKCPGVPGVPPDGCPRKYTLIEVTKEKIELKQTVYFDTRKATIKPVSFALLNEVAQALIDNPKIFVRVEGHTDSQGNGPFNMVLSQHRAESVRNYLIIHGVASNRMEPKGYGKTMPIADNRTQKGRDQNRRVEFVITAQ